MTIDSSNKRVSREIGLELGAIYGKYFLKSQHLHYGYWTSDLQVDVANLRIAQENYAKFLTSHIPDGVKTILDVGCGTGQMARKLVDLGYQVDCVSPSRLLGNQARELLGNTSHIFECFYEQLQTENRYDLILFSESFQYIDPEEAVSKTFSLLREDGCVLICDIFKKDMPDKSPISGGHSLGRLYDIVSEYPLELLEDLDITEQTAPTLDIANDMLNEVVKPTIELGQQLLDSRYPFTSKVLKFLYRKRINKINSKYFSGVKTSENFKKFKSYRLLLCRKRPLAHVCQLPFTDPRPGTMASKPGERIRISAMTASPDSGRLDWILHHLKKARLFALISAFTVVVVQNIVHLEKPHELLPLKDQVSLSAIVGLILVLAGAFIRFWASGHFQRERMLTTGPYAIVRHPLYLGSLLVVCGILLQLNDWMNWIIVLPVFTIFYAAAIIYEERRLEKRFSKQWHLYKIKTPAIIPALRVPLLQRQARKWSWKTYLSTGESWITLALLSLPLSIELILEDLLFEGMLHI